MGVDKHGNLWVANWYTIPGSKVATDILEYPRDAIQPSTTLNVPDGLKATDVAIDSNDTVYACSNGAQYYTAAGVLIYPKGSVNPTQVLSDPGLDPANVEGIAVDNSGDIFVSYEGYSSGTGLNEIGEFVPEGTSYTFKNLVTENCTDCSAGDLKIDSAGNLVEAFNGRDTGGAVHVYSPPKWHLKKKLGDPTMSATGVALSPKDNMMLVTYPYLGDIELYSYPSGKLINGEPFSGFSGPDQRSVAMDP
jgi:hypothetical protein